MRSWLPATVLALAVALAPRSAHSACGTTTVCADVFASFHGHISGDTVTVEWETTNENATILEYRILRYDCGTPATCTVPVTVVPASGVNTYCGVLREYDYTEEDVPDVETWTYVVEVWRQNPTMRVCSIDTVPDP